PLTGPTKVAWTMGRRDLHTHPMEGSMRQLNARRRVALGLAATTGRVLGVAVMAPAGVALTKGGPDHLQCSAVRDIPPAVRNAVKLPNWQSGASECKINLRSTLLCAPTSPAPTPRTLSTASRFRSSSPTTCSCGTAPARSWPGPAG